MDTITSHRDVTYDLDELLPPEPRTVEEERLFRKQRVAATLRLFAKFGFGEGAAGHVTARDPEHPQCFWVNPFAMHFSQIKVSDLLLVSHDGEVLEGRRQVNRAAFAIHSRVHEARPDVVAACHTHSLYGKAWSALGRTLDPLTQDACAFYEDHGLFDDYSGIVVTLSEGERLAAALGGHKAAILRNHGLLTVGGSVEEAAWWYITMERSCHAQLLAEAAGTPVLIDPDDAKLTHEQVGTPLAGRISFQPLWDMITAEQPDLLD